jgi:2-oxoglutarate dehydrogenase complex dehydrogenase (E1) component-like enzyme
LYKQIAKMTPVARIYEKEVVDNGHVTQEQVDEMKKGIQGHLEEAYLKSKTTSYKSEDWMTPEWTSIMHVD